MSDDDVTVEHLPGGSYIASGSYEDLMELERKNQEAALNNLLPVQRELLDGRAFCWFSYNGELDLACFGEVDSVEEASEKEKALLGPEDDEPFDYAQGRRNGYAFSRTYSAWEPSGELGDVHLLELIPIPREAFEKAKECGWDMSALVQADPAIYIHVVSAWNNAVVAKAKGGA